MTLNLLSLNRSSTRLQSSSIELQIYCCRLIYSVAFCLHLSFIKLQIAGGFLAGLIETLWGSCCCCCCCWNRLGMLMVVGSIWFLSIFGRWEGRLNDTSTPKEWKIRMELFSVWLSATLASGTVIPPPPPPPPPPPSPPSSSFFFASQCRHHFILLLTTNNGSRLKSHPPISVRLLAPFNCFLLPLYAMPFNSIQLNLSTCCSDMSSNRTTVSDKKKDTDYYLSVRLFKTWMDNIPMINTFFPG